MTVFDPPHPPEGPAVTRQVDLYGLSWSERLHRLMGTYHLTQARLAAAIGLSAPMVSQLISGQRVKISNPAVYARVVRLEELAASPGVRAGDRQEIDRVLAEVAGATPTLTTGLQSTPGGPQPVSDRDQLIRLLAATAPAGTLRQAATTIAGTPLGTILSEAADRAGAR